MFTHERFGWISYFPFSRSVRAEPVEAFLSLKNPSTSSGRTERSRDAGNLTVLRFLGYTSGNVTIPYLFPGLFRFTFTELNAVAPRAR